MNRIATKSRTGNARAAARRTGASGPAPSAKGPLTAEQLHKMDAWWRAANYLSVGQTYLYDNPLLKEPLNFIYVHLNRVIKERDLDMIYIIGPGHGGPGIVANTWLEGTYSETYPNISQDEDGMKRLFKQFSFPGGIPSHVAPETPGSIHEGGEPTMRTAPRGQRARCGRKSLSHRKNPPCRPSRARWHAG